MPPATRSTTDSPVVVHWTPQEPVAQYSGRRRAAAQPEPASAVEVTEVIERTALPTPVAAEAPASQAPQYRTRAEARAARIAEQSGRRGSASRVAAPPPSARPASTVLPSTTVLPGPAMLPPTQPAASPNVRRAPHARHQPAQSAQPAQPGPRHRALAVVGALAAVAGLGGIAVAAGALPSEAAGQAAVSLNPSASAAGSALSGSSTLSTEQSSSRLAGGTLDKAFRMVAVSRSEERGAIAGCSGKAPTESYSNGQLPTSILCSLPFASGHRLRADAAVRLIRLNEVYRGQFGENLCLTDSYRSLASQYSVAARKPGLAARPGTSEHGWGLAIDVCKGPDQTGSARRAWFLTNAPKFGWDNPGWARPGTGSRPEPWHWEFVEGESKSQSSGE